MLKAKLESYSYLRTYLKPLTAVGIVKADITENSINFRGIDSSNTMFMELNIDKNKFKEYKLNPEPLSVVFEVEDFIRAIQRTSGCDLEINEGQIKVEDKEKRIILPLLSNEVRNLPEKLVLNFENALTIKGSNLKGALADITAFSDKGTFYSGYSDEGSVRLDINNKEVILSHRTPEGKEVIVRVEGNKRGLDKFVETTKKVSLLLSIELLKQAVRYINDMVKVYVGKNTPLQLETENLKVIIAPRVERDFDEDYSNPNIPRKDNETIEESESVENDESDDEPDDEDEESDEEEVEENE